VNRRSLLTSVALALATRRLPLPSYTAVARADEKSLRHGLALFGDFKYPAGFKQFDYVNASAPKGGTVRQIALGTYDSFNIVVDGVKGALVLGIDLNYDTLLVPALDEVASEYGLLAEAVSYPDDFSSASFRLRATAKWHDSTPVTPEDVIFSFETFRKLSPQAGANYQHVAKAEKVGIARSLLPSMDRATEACRRSWGNLPSCKGLGGKGPIRTGRFDNAGAATWLRSVPH
jgi:microcin C transport system substrate-binding protein